MAKPKPYSTKKQKEEVLEDILSSCRDSLRGRATLTDKRDMLLTLVFLKFLSEHYHDKLALIQQENVGVDNVVMEQMMPYLYKQVGIFQLSSETDWEELKLNENKKGGQQSDRKLRDRSGEVLFVDLRSWSGNIYEKKYVKLSPEQIEAVHRIYTDWQTLPEAGERYEQPELYRSVKSDEIERNNWSLVPSRYIEFVDRDGEIDFEKVLKDAGTKVKDLLQRQEENRTALINAFKAIGYEAD